MPPVTAERSPPHSRMTGAHSPVIALSSTDATPSTTSPSPGMTSPGRQTTRSPRRSCSRAALPRYARVDRRGRCPALRSRFAVRLRARLPQRVRLRLAAPLGHRLGEVREEDGEPEPERELEREAPVAAALRDVAHEHERRVRVPISTTNITGFRTMWRGSSLTNASRIARRTIGGSNSGRLRAGALPDDAWRLGGRKVGMSSWSEQLPGAHQQVLDDRAERERREEGERADDQDRRRRAGRRTAAP